MSFLKVKPLGSLTLTSISGVYESKTMNQETMWKLNLKVYEGV